MFDKDKLEARMVRRLKFGQGSTRSKFETSYLSTGEHVD
jgi:hypothetical protein